MEIEIKGFMNKNIYSPKILYLYIKERRSEVVGIYFLAL